MKKVLALGASNSKKSINKTLASYAAKKLTNVEVEVIDLNDFQMPIYGVDLENTQGIPQKAIQLNKLISEADALVLSLAEHNGSYTAAFKNTIDWLSRIDTKVWQNKPLLLLATSPGARGGANVLQSAKTYFPHMGANIVADLSLAKFYENFTEDKISNKEIEEALNEKIKYLEQEINGL